MFFSLFVAPNEYVLFSRVNPFDTLGCHQSFTDHPVDLGKGFAIASSLHEHVVVVGAR